MNDARKISDLNTANTLALTDRVVVLVNPNTTANVLTITANTFAMSIPAMTLVNSTPINSSSPGTKNQITYDSNYIYVCVANNVWKRVSLNSF